MVWREGEDHITIKEINSKNKHSDVPSAIRPISHGPDISVSKPKGNMEYSSDSKPGDVTVVAVDNAYKPEEEGQPISLIQAKLNDLTRDLNLSKDSSVNGFTSQRETSVGTRNIVLLVSRP